MEARDCWIQGRSIPSDLLGPLQETDLSTVNGAVARSRLGEDGYLFFRKVLDRGDVVAAREEVFVELAKVGEIREPAIEGIATGESRRREVVGDLGRFWRSVSEGEKLRKVSHGEQAGCIMSTIFGQPARPHDYIFLRPGVPGRATFLHYDHPFFARGSKSIYTVWTALGDIPVSEGPLVVVEGSHRFDDLIEPILAIDYESDDSPQVQLPEDTIRFARKRGTRLLTSDFHPGDLIVFTMTTLHGSLDNHSTMGQTRLSCDVRWQPATDPIDPRYVGPDPAGTTGAGYGELNGAKPLNETWHTR